jgi:hypothetical protein
MTWESVRGELKNEETIYFCYHSLERRRDNGASHCSLLMFHKEQVEDRKKQNVTSVNHHNRSIIIHVVST